MTRDALSFWLNAFSAACWFLCFWWMHQISARQDKLIAQLRQQASRIEQLSKTEHDLIREVHPQVGEIKETVQEVALEVKNGKV
jgi:cell division protein FtsB